RPWRAVAVRVLHRRRRPRRRIAAERCARRTARLRRRRARARVLPGRGAMNGPRRAEPCSAALRSLRPYDPGHDLVALRRAAAPELLVELGSNENPYGPAPGVRAAMETALATVHRYPVPFGGDLKQALAVKHGVEPAQLILGNGSHELLMQLGQVFAGPGVDVVFSQYGFAVFAIATAAAG